MEFSCLPNNFPSYQLLLHETLEHDEDNSNNNNNFNLDNNDGGHTLHNVLEFLRQFPQYPDVVVTCARKTDASVWERLFSFAGDPHALFEECMTSKRTHTAASCLRILQVGS